MSKRKKKKPASPSAVEAVEAGEAGEPEQAEPEQAESEAAAESEGAAGSETAPEAVETAAESESPATEAEPAPEADAPAGSDRDPRDELPTHEADQSVLDLEALAGQEFDAEMTVNLAGETKPLPGRDDLDDPTVTVSGEVMKEVDRVVLQRKHLRGLLEALVFASDSPITPKQLAKLASAQQKQVKELLAELKQDYATRGVHLDEVAGGWVFRTSPQYAPFVRDLTKQKPVRLTRAQVETLAIIAYRQPITRPEVDDVRGVDSGPVLKLLLERDLVRILGKRDEPGRPLIYGTTGHFLEFFGLKSLKDLPTLREFTELSDESREAFEDELGETPEEAAARQAAENAGGATEGESEKADAASEEDGAASAADDEEAEEGAAPASARIPVDEHSGDLDEALGALVSDELGEDEPDAGELDETEGALQDSGDVEEEISASSESSLADDALDDDDEPLDDDDGSDDDEPLDDAAEDP